MSLFTPQNAREKQAKSVEARRRNKVAVAIADLPAQEPSQEQPQSNGYSAEQIARVRGHLAKVDELLAEAMAKGDPQDIERLARARGALEEQERRASDRSLPPVRRVAETKGSGKGGVLAGHAYTSEPQAPAGDWQE